MISFDKFVREGLNEGLNEGLVDNLVVVDIQPSYNNVLHKILPNIINNIKKASHILYYYNTNGYLNTLDEVKNYLIDNGLDEYYITDIIFIEGPFGYFRELFNKTTNIEIVKLIKVLYNNKMYGIQDLDKGILDKLPDNYKDVDFNFPHPDKTLGLLRKNGQFLLMGGEKEGSIKEMMLLCSAFNINYKLAPGCVY